MYIGGKCQLKFVRDGTRDIRRHALYYLGNILHGFLRWWDARYKHGSQNMKEIRRTHDYEQPLVEPQLVHL